MLQIAHILTFSKIHFYNEKCFANYFLSICLALVAHFGKVEAELISTPDTDFKFHSGSPIKL
jgi:tRNA isopentenyl-2-thiomethyl-A-37 hydroxylase MiaE